MYNDIFDNFGDGDIDIAVVNQSSNTVSILKNRNRSDDIVLLTDLISFGDVQVASKDMVVGLADTIVFHLDNNEIPVITYIETPQDIHNHHHGLSHYHPP